MSSKFQTALKKSLPWHVEDKIDGKTSAGQSYVIVVNSLVWYKVRLFLDEDHLKDGRKLEEFHCSQHATKDGAMEHVIWIQNRLQRSPLLEFTNIDSRLANLKYYFSCVEYSNDCKQNPDRYLKRGDHVQISRKCGFYTHAGIYLGNGRVIHISDDNSPISKRCARAREDSWKNFVGVCDDGSTSWFGVVSVIVYRLRIRTPDQIVASALEMASDSYGQGKYNFFLKNCQHFASYCSTGKEVSPEVNRFFDTLVLGLFPVLAVIHMMKPSPLYKEP